MSLQTPYLIFNKHITIVKPISCIFIILTITIQGTTQSFSSHRHASHDAIEELKKNTLRVGLATHRESKLFLYTIN